MELFSVLITVLAITIGIAFKNARPVTHLLLFLLFVLITFEFTREGDGDYALYEYIYESVGYGEEWALISYEPLFVLFLRICYSLGLSLVAVKGVMAVIVLTLLYKTITTYTKNTALVLALFFIYPAMFDAELMRWLLAESFIVYGFKFIIRARVFKDYLLYGVFILIATLFHIGSAPFILFFLLAIKNRRFLALAIIISTIAIVVVRTATPLYSILNSLPFGDHLQEKYQTGYVGSDKVLLASTLRYIQVFLIAVVAYYFTGYKTTTVIKNRNDMGGILCSQIMPINIIMLLFIGFNLFSSQAQRMYHVILLLNYIFLAVKGECKTNCFVGISAGTILALSCLFVGLKFISEGAVLAFQSHFTVGYLTRMFQMLFGG